MCTYHFLFDILFNAVLTTTAQQPQTYPLAITTHQAGELVSCGIHFSDQFATAIKI